MTTSFADTAQTVERAPRSGTTKVLPRGADGARVVRSQPGITTSAVRRSLWLRPGIQTYEVRFAIRRPDGTTGEPILFSITATPSDGGAVISERGSDAAGFLTFESQIDTRSLTSTYTFTRSSTVGEPVTSVLPKIHFMQDLESPNVLQIAWGHGPLTDYGEIPPRKRATFPASVMEYLDALAVLQRRSTTPVRIPDLSTVTNGDADAVKEAAMLVRGETVTTEWTRFRWRDGPVPARPRQAEHQANIDGDEEREIDLASYYELIIIEPLIVSVGEQEHILGAVHTHLLSVRFVVEEGELRALPYLNDTMRRTFAPHDQVPDRSHRPVKGRVLGAIDRKAELASEDQARLTLESLRNKIILEGRSQPVAVGLVYWHATDVAPAAPREQVQSFSLTAIETFISDGLFEFVDSAPNVEGLVASRLTPDELIGRLAEADADQFGSISSFDTGPWLKLTEKGEEVAQQLSPATAANAPQRRRRLHIAASGRSGQNDISERIDEIFAAEAGQ